MPTLLKYAIVGITGATIHFLTLFYLVEKFQIHPIVSSSIGFILTVLVSYFPNYYWTFKANSSHKKTLARYTVVSLSGFASNFIAFTISYSLLSLHYGFSQAVATVVVPLTNFILNKYWTFNK
jgi:putative flippase GtrA